VELRPRSYPAKANLIAPELFGIETIFRFLGKLGFNVFPIFGVRHSKPMLIGRIEPNLSFAVGNKVTNAVGEVSLIFFTGDMLVDKAMPVSFEGIKGAVSKAEEVHRNPLFPR